MSAVDRINAVLAQSFETAQDKRAALMAARASEFSGMVGARDITRGRYGISILKGKVSGGQVELFARVFRDGVQIGFGPDGSVDVERFVIVNPPVLVKDATGDVPLIRRGVDGNQVETRYRVNVLDVVRDALADMILKAGKANGKIVPNREGQTTYTIFSNGANDGYIQSSNGTYSTARAGSNLSATSNTVDVYIGQLEAGEFSCYEGFVNFTTSTVAGTISAATLSIYGQFDGSDTNFTVNARLSNYTASGLTTADWIAGASLSGQTLLATFATSGGWSDAAYNVFSSEAAFITNIDQSGNTGIMLSSSRHQGNNAPGVGTFEYVGAYGGVQTGTTNDPRLVVEATAGFTRTFTGPFWGPFRGPFG